MIYLLGVVFIATLQGEYYGPPILTAVLSSIFFDYFFTHPRFSLSIAHSSDIITLIVMFIVAQVISHLSIHIRKHLEEIKFAQMQTEKERYRNLLLSSISHDLRTPLAAIIGAASLLCQSNEKLSVGTRHELAKDIYDESERLNKLITNVLQIIRLETTDDKVIKEFLPIEEVIGSSLNALEKLLQHRQLTVLIPPDLPQVPVDHILVEKVFINLIENAVKFSPHNSPIEISARLDKNQLIISVRDYGQGILPDDLIHLFEKFYQGKKSNHSGIGLGLAICKDIVKSHGGHIWVENCLDQGAKFSFSLPL